MEQKSEFNYRQARGDYQEDKNLSSDQKKNILKQRAWEIAQIGPSIVEHQGVIDVVEFKLAKETYAIESRHIREVYPYKTLSILPSVPDFVLGVVNVRRRILSVIDLKVFFDLPQISYTHRNKLIILENKDLEFAILTDVITGVQSLPLNKIQFAHLPTLTGKRQQYLKGITSEGLIVLDGEKLLSDVSIIVANAENV